MAVKSETNINVLAEDNECVRRKDLVGYLKSSIKQEESFKNLPWSLWLIVIYTLMFTYGVRSDLIRSVENAITHDVRENANFAFESTGNAAIKTIEDVNSIADFWSWMRLGFVPLLVKDATGVSESSGLLAERRSIHQRTFYLEQLRVVGGIRMRTRSAKTVDCQNQALKDALFRGDNVSFRCTEPSMANHLLPDIMEVFENPTSAADKTEWLLMQGGPDFAGSLLNKWESQGLVDLFTERVELMFTVYSGNINVVTMAAVNFFFTRSGHIWKRISCRSLYLPPLRTEAIIFMVLFYVSVLAVFVLELLQILGLARESRKNKESWNRCVRAYIGPWELVDWSTIVVGIVMFVLHMRCLSYTYVVESMLREVPAREDEALTCAWRHGFAKEECYAKHAAWLFDAVTESEQREIVFRTLAGFYPIIIMARLFKAFSAQPRLAIVTHTLWCAAEDLFHFGIVFISIFFSYAVMGCILFGRTLVEYSTLNRSLMAMFRALFGDIDFDAMYDEGKAVAVIFYISFMMVLVLVMLNMLVAIFMDVYAQVKVRTSNATGLFLQTRRLLVRRREIQAGLRVPFRKILEALEKQIAEEHLQCSRREQEEDEVREVLSFESILKPDETADVDLGADALRRLVPGLQDWQIARMMEGTTAWLKTEGEKVKVADDQGNDQGTMAEELYTSVREALERVEASCNNTAVLEAVERMHTHVKTLHGGMKI